MPMALYAMAIMTRQDASHEYGAIAILFILVVDGIAFYAQSFFAYCVMNMISPVSHSVANTAKRAILIILSIHHYGNTVLFSNWIGMGCVIGGVFGYNHAMSLSQKRQQVTSLHENVKRATAIETV